jgi:hypothetical protein
MNQTEPEGETSITIEQRLMDEKIASGEVEKVGVRESDDVVLYRVNPTEYKGA